MFRTKTRDNFTLILITILMFLPLINHVNSINVESNSYTITLYENGTATWIIESKIPLNSEEELEAFLNYMENFDKYRGEILENFTKRISKIIQDTSLQVGRDMRVENIEVSADTLESITGKLGLIRYEFKWIGFAHAADDKIIVGDVFIGGFYLYDGDLLIVTVPVNYTISEVYPTPDITGENYVIWYGKKVFPDRTPALILSKKKYVVEETMTISKETTLKTETSWSQTTLTSPTHGMMTISGETISTSPIHGLIYMLPITITVILFATLLVMVALIFLRKKTSREKFTVKDAEIVVNVIKELGGTAYQKKIVEKTGFSKSKVSEILKALEKNKIIEKIKVGREYLIVLKKKDY